MKKKLTLVKSPPPTLTPERFLSPYDAEELRNTLKSRRDAAAQVSLLLCESIHKAYHCRVAVNDKMLPPWRVWGYQSWEDFAEAEVGIHAPTARLYAKVWQRFGIDLAGSWNPDHVLPITKMKVLAQAKNINRGNVNAWMKRAAKMTCCQLEAEVFGHDRERIISFVVTPREFAELSRTIAEARDFFGTGGVHRGQVITEIIRDWKVARAPGKRFRRAG